MIQFTVTERTATREGRATEIKVVAVKGELDIGAGVEQISSISSELVDGGAVWMLFDLSCCDYVVSRGFGQILVVMARLRSKGGDVAVAGARPHVLTAINAVGLNNILGVHNSVDEAIRWFEERGALIKTD